MMILIFTLSLFNFAQQNNEEALNRKKIEEEMYRHQTEIMKLRLKNHIQAKKAEDQKLVDEKRKLLNSQNP